MKPILKEMVVRFWPDYVALAVVGSGLVILREAVGGTKQAFTEDVLIETSFPYKSDTVPGWVLGTFNWVIPIAIFLSQLAFGSSVFRTHQHCISFLVMYGATGVLSNVIKLQVGRPRPSFTSRCFPGINQEDITLSNSNLFSPLLFSNSYEALCTSTDTDEINNAYKSFLSGHAAYSAASGMYLTLFLFKTLGVYNGRATSGHVLVSLVPVATGGWIGLTRISDYEHHPTDVLGGFLLGCTIATVFFFHANSIQETETDKDEPVSEGPVTEGLRRGSVALLEAVEMSAATEISRSSLRE